MSHNEILAPCSICPNWFWVSADHLADVHHEGNPVKCDWCGSEFRFSLHGDIVKQGEWPNDDFRKQLKKMRTVAP